MLDLEVQSEERQTLHMVVPNIRERERIDKFLSRQVENATRTKVQQAIEEGRVLVNGNVVKSNYKVAPSDKIEITLTRPPAPKMKPEDIPLDIVYEDETLLVVNKSAGMVVHPAFGNWTGTLANAVLHHTRQRLSDAHDDEFRPGIVHRLDKDTSGLMVVAKENDAHFALAKQFAQRTTEKKYLALAWGVPKSKSGTIQTNIGRSKKNRKVMSVYEFESEDGKRAITDYVIKEDFRYFSLLELTLHTGRTHQIRVHLQHIGNPIVSDETYGGKILRSLGFSHSEQFVGNLFEVIPRQALHAAFLSFVHPKTKTKISFEAPLPSDMQQAIEKIRRLIR